MSAFAYLLSDKYTQLSSGIPLSKYKVFIQKNWDNCNLANSNIYDFNNKDNNKNINH